VPVVCRFAGIVVMMYHNDHNPPHFHARYGGHLVVLEIQTLRVYAGSLPRPQLNELSKWAADRREGLMQNWDLARRGQPLQPLAPP
jgi:Domain of unknown function (DUF4160)